MIPFQCILLLLMPVSPGVACGRDLEFRYLTGLVPDSGWTGFATVPIKSTETFTELAWNSSEHGLFRVLSAGPTMGMNPTVSSVVERSGWAASIAEGDVVLSCVDSGSYSVSASWRAVEARYSRRYAFQGQFRNDSYVAAGGPEAFIAGWSPRVFSGVRIGPLLCRDTLKAEPWLRIKIDTGLFSFVSDGAIVQGESRRRASAGFRPGIFAFRVGYDEDRAFGSAALDSILILEFPDWGFAMEYHPAEYALLSISHRQGGEMAGEFQYCWKGFLGGMTFEREQGGDFHAGITAGIHTGSENRQAPAL